MSSILASAAIQTFASRLATLEHLLRAGAAHLNEPEHAYLQRRLAPDMLPLGAQIAFTCNQPRNFSLWMQGKSADDLDPGIVSCDAAYRCIDDTRQLVRDCEAAQRTPPSSKHLVLGPGLSADLSSEEYLHDFLLPNFYFHLVTTYAILRMSDVPLGKRDYMLHLLPRVNQNTP